VNLTNLGLSILVLIAVGSCSLEPVHQVLTNMESSSQKTRPMSLPEKCRPLLGTPDPTSWDPVSDSYPTDGKWAECMGVGKK